MNSLFHLLTDKVYKSNAIPLVLAHKRLLACHNGAEFGMVESARIRIQKKAIICKVRSRTQA